MHRMRDAGGCILSCFVIRASVNAIVDAAAAVNDDIDGDDASQSDVIALHPKHLLLANLGPSSTKKLVLGLYISLPPSETLFHQ